MCVCVCLVWDCDFYGTFWQRRKLFLVFGCGLPTGKSLANLFIYVIDAGSIRQEEAHGKVHTTHTQTHTNTHAHTHTRLHSSYFVVHMNSYSGSQANPSNNPHNKQQQQQQQQLTKGLQLQFATACHTHSSLNSCLLFISS